MLCGLWPIIQWCSMMFEWWESKMSIRPASFCRHSPNAYCLGHKYLVWYKNHLILLLFYFRWLFSLPLKWNENIIFHGFVVCERERARARSYENIYALIQMCVWMRYTKTIHVRTNIVYIYYFFYFLFLCIFVFIHVMQELPCEKYAL